jgi:hypothetical protein
MAMQPEAIFTLTIKYQPEELSLEIFAMCLQLNLRKREKTFQKKKEITIVTTIPQ